MNKPNAKVLVIYPERSVQESLRLILEIKGVSVKTANTLTEGMQNIKSDMDMVITGHFQNQLDGIEAIETIKEKYPDIPIVTISSYCPYSQEEFELAGAIKFLQLPFLTEDIYELLERTIKLRHEGNPK
jgi:DNA-binding NtrC family response regulator